MSQPPEKASSGSPLAELIQQLKRLPGIGEKGAQRLAFFLIKSPPELSESLSLAIQSARNHTTLCPHCFNFSLESQSCSICRNSNRDPHLLCIVETPVDLQAVEKTGIFRGRYHVLHGALSPLDGIGPESLKIPELMERLEKEPVQELILALNPNVKGDATAHYLAEKLKPRGLKVTRIASGVPAGSELEYLDRSTIERAVKYRRDWD